jgi:uncharacterized protein (TIGR01244 family)
MKNLIAGLFIAITATGTLACAPAAPNFRKIDTPDIMNFTRVDGAPVFAGTVAGLGGATAPPAMQWLREEGFVTVINLRAASEAGANVDGSRAAAEAAGLTYIHLPFEPGHPDPDLADEFLAAVTDEANQPVYIHCSSATRVAALWMIGRVATDGLDFETASKEVEAITPRSADAIAIATRYLASGKDQAELQHR